MVYKKTKDYLLCIDSDGCVMDAMDIKHMRAFGPSIIEEWDLHEYKEELLKRWNEINLYSITRGINRFKGLIMILKEINDKYKKIQGLESILSWVENTAELGEDSIKKELEKSDGIGLMKTLSWSQRVNKIIKEIPKEDITPFEGAYEAIKKASCYCDIAVVSSANKEAVIQEWERYGILDFVNIVMAQDSGTKAECIKKLLKFGYDKSKCIMIGDAKGDMSSAQENGVYYYPILVGKEKKSWEQFDKVLMKLILGRFDEKMQNQLIDDFYKNLNV